jgi:protein TonB
MIRLGLALVLAFAGHLALFLSVIPGRQDVQPRVQGIRQVKVRIYHPVSEPVVKSEEAGIRKMRQPMTTVVDRSAKTAAPAAPENLSPLPLTKLEPAERKRTATGNAGNKPQKPHQPLEGPQTKPEETIRAGENRKTEQSTSPAAVPESIRPAATVLEAVPLYTENKPPEYPVMARRRGWEGTVLLEVFVAVDGTVRTARIQTGSSYSMLDDAALDAVRNWRFQPGMENGRPKAMKVLVPVHFVLKDVQ